MRIKAVKKQPQSRPAPASEYDEVRFREALRVLGLFAPVTMEEIQTAYRRRAKTYHPDRVALHGDAAEATRQMERINLAHGYVVRHYQTFDRTRNRALRRAMAGEAPVRAWQEILLLPVIAGLAYEVIRFAGKHPEHRALRTLLAPGLWLQRLTTREPTLDQVEVSIRALREVLRLEGRITPEERKVEVMA